MFAYPDAARYRVGANYQQLPTNAAKAPVYSPFERDGFMNFKGNYGPDPNYVRSTLRPLKYGPATVGHDHWVGKVTAFTSEVTDEDFVQPRAMWEMFGRTGQQETVVKNISGHLKLAIPELQKEAISKSSSSSTCSLDQTLISLQRYLRRWIQILPRGLRKELLHDTCGSTYEALSRIK
jgi:catalase